MYAMRCKGCGYAFYLKEEDKKAWDEGWLEPSCPNRSCKYFDEYKRRDTRKVESIWKIEKISDS